MLRLVPPHQAIALPTDVEAADIKRKEVMPFGVTGVHLQDANVS